MSGDAEHGDRLNAVQDGIALMRKDFSIPAAILALLSGIALSLTIHHMAGL